MEIDTDKLTHSFLCSMGGDKAVTSTGEMAKFGSCLVVNMLEYLKQQVMPTQQAYGTASEIAKFLGRNVNSIRDWLRKLENQGRIKPIQGAPLRDGAVGDTLYKFVEVEKALRQERINFRKEKTHER